MNLKNDVNYCILSNNIDSNFLNKFVNIPIFNSDLNYEELKSKLEFFPNKKVVFNESFYNFRKDEIINILNLLNTQHINYINVTSNIEEALLADYLQVYDKDNLVLEGSVEEVLKEEKKLKKIGYGLPFVVDLSTQLNYYDIFNKIYYKMESLVGDLWN